MLAKANRLTKEKEFTKTFRKGRSSYDEIMGVKVVKNGLQINRFGIIVGRKISKKAFERNKIKRQIRAIIRSKIELIKKGNDVLIIVSPEALIKTFHDLEKSIYFNFKKLEIL